MTATRDATIAARIPVDLREALEALIPHHGEDLSTVIRRALRAYADQHGTQGNLLADAIADTAPPAGYRYMTSSTAELAPLDSLPPSHTNGTETERTAAIRAWPRAETGRRRVLDAIHHAGARGRTSDELVLELNLYSAQRRLHDLKRGGWVRVAENADGQPIRRLTRRGAPADVYILTRRAVDKFTHIA